MKKYSYEPAFMSEAIRLSHEGMMRGEGGPFGAVIVKDGQVIGRGWNRVLSSNDPTAHAEVTAIREACAFLGSFQLDGCVLYTSCEPCPMCLGAIYWARPEAVYFANSREDAAAIGFDDAFIYHEIPLAVSARRIPMQAFPDESAKKVFESWMQLPGKTMY